MREAWETVCDRVQQALRRTEGFVPVVSFSSVTELSDAVNTWKYTYY